MYRGSHSTSFDRARKIQSCGFSITRGSCSRKGTGIYFWAESRRYIQLASAWYTQKLKRGDFDTDKDLRGMVIIAVVEATEDGYLDLEDQQTIDALDEFIEKKRIDVSTWKNISEAIDLFVETAEEEIGISIVLVGICISPPSVSLLSIWFKTHIIYYIVMN